VVVPAPNPEVPPQVVAAPVPPPTLIPAATPVPLPTVVPAPVPVRQPTQEELTNMNRVQIQARQVSDAGADGQGGAASENNIKI
jgi:hypothetical protein